MNCKKCGRRIWFFWDKSKITGVDGTMKDEVDGYYHNKCSPFFALREHMK